MLKFYLMIVFLTCCQNSFDTTCKRTYSSRWQKQDDYSVEYAAVCWCEYDGRVSADDSREAIVKMDKYLYVSSNRQ